MDATDVIVIVAGPASMAGPARYFFAPRDAAVARTEGGRQVVDITARGGYPPNQVRVEAGTPVRLRSEGQDNSDCTPRVVFPDVRRSATLEASAHTTLDPDVPEPGEYAWACGMSMLHGTLVAGAPGGAGTRAAAQPASAGPDADGGQVVEAAGGVTQRWENATAVGVGPRLDGLHTVERADALQGALQGALRGLPIDTVRAQAELRALSGVDGASVDVGAERAVLTDDPGLVDPDGLWAAVAAATGFPASLRPAPGMPGTDDPEAQARAGELSGLVTAIALGDGLLYPFTGALLSPLIAAAAMAVSSISVGLDSARLNRFQPPVLAGAPATTGIRAAGGPR